MNLLKSLSLIAITELLLITSHGNGQNLDLAYDQMKPGEYNPVQILKAANKLIAVGEVKAYESMLSYRPEVTNKFDDRSIYYEYVTWLCVLLYDAKPKTFLEVPLFGKPSFPFYRDYHQDNAAWPKFPLAISGKTPFYIATGYSLAGYAYPSSYYVKLYHEKGVFRLHPYMIPTNKEATTDLRHLLDSSSWKTLDWKSAPNPGEKVIISSLYSQIDRIAP